RGFTTETQYVARLEGQPGRGFLMAAFPRLAAEEKPVFTRWAGADGLKITWKGETHYLLLALAPRTVTSDGITATAACLVVKVADRKNFTISLPLGGTASFGGKKVSGTAPIELVVENGKAKMRPGTNLMPVKKP
ncbi:MAG TPA: hypothetical protein PLZ36_04970, partial [Armatimonadota bacterium]|nr:hypothetical protein [Armatimonadota bacterium]